LLYKGGQYKPFTDAGVKRIHEAAMTLLGKGGVKVFTETGREAFKRAGADVDQSTNLVKIPQGMVEDAIDSASAHA